MLKVSKFLGLAQHTLGHGLGHILGAFVHMVYRLGFVKILIAHVALDLVRVRRILRNGFKLALAFLIDCLQSAAQYVVLAGLGELVEELKRLLQWILQRLPIRCFGNASRW